MVSAPLGNNPYAYGSLMPWAIVWLYKFLNIFSEISIEYAAIILPVILFSLTLVFFFLFVQKAFSYLMKKEFSYVGAVIATLLYAVIPQMLHRTTAGVPEIESLGMPFFWLAFYFFTMAWQSEKTRSSLIFAILSGISTGIMIWSWGGNKYIFMSFSLATFIAFFFQNLSKKNISVFGIWWLISIASIILKGTSLTSMLSSIQDTLFSTIVLFIILFDLVLWNYILKNKEVKINKKILSLIISAVLMLVLATVFFGPNFVISKFTGIAEGFLHPFGEGRVGLTVAENRAPYFVEVYSAFAVGFFKTTISLFWLFFLGTILIFYEAIKHFDKRNKYLLFVSFVLFVSGSIFSRISPQNILNGENFISNLFYFGSLLLFAGIALYVFFKEKDNLENNFYKINFAYILVLSLIFFAIISMRGAVRLFFIISPPVVIASSFLFVKLSEIGYETKEKTKRYLILILVVIIFLAISVIAFNYAKQSYVETKYTIPGPYEQQWQYAMAWVRENTNPGDIFVHWWDYGYWTQTIGERPTVTDGGHLVEFWDHTTARYLMTAENEKTTLQLLKAYNVSYVLFDSTDIGKYGAFASIGSDKTGKDRLSYIPTFILDEKQTQELKNETVYIYTGGGFILDKDFIWNNELLPQEKAGVPGFLVHSSNNKISLVEAIVVYNNKQYRIPVNYIYLNNSKIKLSDDGLNAILYFIPTLKNNRINSLGAALFLSEKVSKGQFARMYLLNETSMSLAHQEDALLVKQINQAYNLDIEFILANELYGPIKIFKVPDLSKIEYHEEYLERHNLREEDFAKLDYLGT